MNYKKINAPTTTVTHNLMDFSEPTGNIYESVVIMSKRANQITSEIKNDLANKLREFGTKNDSLDEEFENREQEFLDGKIYFRNPAEERDRFDK